MFVLLGMIPLEDNLIYLLSSFINFVVANMVKCDSVYISRVKQAALRPRILIRRVQPTKCKVSQFIYFCKTLYMFQTVLSVQHQELKTAHTASGIGLTNT